MRLRWSRRAASDLQRIGDFIAADKPQAALDFMGEVRARVAHLAEFPLLGRAGIRADTRELIVHRNYLVTYRLRADEVQVLQVWHVARDRGRGR